MNFLDRLRTQRQALEEAETEARRKAEQGELHRRREERHAKEAQRQQVETNKKLYRSAYKYYVQSGCRDYILEILTHLQHQHHYCDLLSTGKPEEYDNPQYKNEPTVFPVPTSVSEGLQWKVSQTTMSAEEAAALAESIDESRYRGSVYSSAEEFVRRIAYEHADYYEVTYSRAITIQMSAEGELIIRGKAATTLAAVDWQRDKRLVDRAFEIATSSPRTIAGVSPGYHPSLTDNSMGLSD